jgi:hypothetical protein
VPKPNNGITKLALVNVKPFIIAMNSFQTRLLVFQQALNSTGIKKDAPVIASLSWTSVKAQTTIYPRRGTVRRASASACPKNALPTLMARRKVGTLTLAAVYMKQEIAWETITLKRVLETAHVVQ